MQIDTAVVGQRHLDHGNQAFAPGDLIRVMLVGPDKHDWLMLLAVALELRCLLISQKPPQETQGLRGAAIRLLAIILILGTPAASAEWAEWIADVDVSYRDNDNINNSAFSDDELDDNALIAEGSIGRYKQLTDAMRLLLTVDLEAQQIRGAADGPIGFEVDPFSRHCLLNGLDDIGLTLQHVHEIRAYEARRRGVTPWLF